MNHEQVSELLNQWADAPEGSIFAPRSIQDIRDRLARANQLTCDCLDSDHENALHDLVQDDVPALLRLVDHLLENRLVVTDADLEDYPGVRRTTWR